MPTTETQQLDEVIASSRRRMLTLGGGNETTLSATTITAANPTTSIGYERTTDQVLHIVYGTGGGAGVKSGTFFPSGLNGNISVTQA